MAVQQANLAEVSAPSATRWAHVADDGQPRNAMYFASCTAPPVSSLSGCAPVAGATGRGRAAAAMEDTLSQELLAYASIAPPDLTDGGRFHPCVDAC